MISRGDIRWFRFSAPDKRRPVLVLGIPSLLSSWQQVPVIPLSTQTRGLTWEVPLSEADGLAEPSVLKPEWIRSVDRSLLGPWITAFPEDRWREVEAAVLRVLGFHEK